MHHIIIITNNSTNSHSNIPHNPSGTNNY